MLPDCCSSLFALFLASDLDKMPIQVPCPSSLPLPM
jgi:hypothetical protein